jgi:hypothetical protein
MPDSETLAQSYRALWRTRPGRAYFHTGWIVIFSIEAIIAFAFRAYWLGVLGVVLAWYAAAAILTLIREGTDSPRRVLRTCVGLHR